MGGLVKVVSLFALAGVSISQNAMDILRRASKRVIRTVPKQFKTPVLLARRVHLGPNSSSYVPDPVSSSYIPDTDTDTDEKSSIGDTFLEHYHQYPNHAARVKYEKSFLEHLDNDQYPNLAARVIRDIRSRRKLELERLRTTRSYENDYDYDLMLEEQNKDLVRREFGVAQDFVEGKPVSYYLNDEDEDLDMYFGHEWSAKNSSRVFLPEDLSHEIDESQIDESQTQVEEDILTDVDSDKSDDENGIPAAEVQNCADMDLNIHEIQTEVVEFPEDDADIDGANQSHTNEKPNQGVKATVSDKQPRKLISQEEVDQIQANKILDDLKFEIRKKEEMSALEEQLECLRN